MYATDWGLDYNSAPRGIKTLHNLLWRNLLTRAETKWLKAARKEQRRITGEQCKRNIPQHLRAKNEFPPWNVTGCPLINAVHEAPDLSHYPPGHYPPIYAD